MIRVLIVDDSPVVQEYLHYLLTADRDIQVVGTARDGREALLSVQQLQPDVVLMDTNMPILNGFEATRYILKMQPVPIIMVSASWEPEAVTTTFQALEAGAVALVEKPRGLGDPEAEKQVHELIAVIKALGKMKMRTSGTPKPLPSPVLSRERDQKHLLYKEYQKEYQLVAIGASTGGPRALQILLSSLSIPFPLPLVVVQHITAGFLPGLVRWLSQATRFPVHIATDEELLLPGRVYLAPDGLHLGIGAGGRVFLSEDAPEHGSRPSISFFFRSVAQVYGAKAIGILLTGMGSDGAAELKMLREKGALTLVQDAASSVVHGMPGEAIRLNAATHILSPTEIAKFLEQLVCRKQNRLNESTRERSDATAGE